VSYQDGMCSLSGECPSAEAMQKAVLLAGNVQGVSGVDIANLLKVPSPTPIEEKVEYYVIQKGDTLSKIAKHYYGDANKYTVIFEANREVIKDADLIFPGQKIRIPAMS
jgi:nucleoid-associated protein YgaU